MYNNKCVLDLINVSNNKHVLLFVAVQPSCKLVNWILCDTKIRFTQELKRRIRWQHF